jgi:hypothetical protein
MDQSNGLATVLCVKITLATHTEFPQWQIRLISAILVPPGVRPTIPV